MIAVLLNVYLVILFCLVKLKIVRFNLFWKMSPVLVLLLLLIGLFVPMNWGAPQGPALVARNSVAIVPDVAGEVLEVPVKANTPLKADDVLFRIDPAPARSPSPRRARRPASYTPASGLVKTRPRPGTKASAARRTPSKPRSGFICRRRSRHSGTAAMRALSAIC
jgi:hypothetical protein